MDVDILAFGNLDVNILQFGNFEVDILTVGNVDILAFGNFDVDIVTFGNLDVDQKDAAPPRFGGLHPNGLPPFLHSSDVEPSRFRRKKMSSGKKFPAGKLPIGRWGPSPTSHNAATIAEMYFSRRVTGDRCYDF
jgi:hypothetical protein